MKRKREPRHPRPGILVTLAVALALPAGARAEDAGAEDAGVEPSCGDLVIVFDRSGSMFYCSIDGKTKEAIALDALGSIISMNEKVPMGLMVFPNTIKMCGVTTHCRAGEFAVDIGPDSARQVHDYLRAMPTSCGGTPTGDAMVAVRDYAGWTPGKRHYVLLMTDGQPTCQDDHEGKCNGGGRSECPLPTKAFESIDTMRKRGIHTFVVGFEGAATMTGGTDLCERPFNPETLETMAELGGEAQAGPTKYFSATNEATLLDALKRISERVVGSTAGCGPAPGSDGGSGDVGPADGAAAQDASSLDARTGERDEGGCGCALDRPAAGWPALVLVAVGFGLGRRRIRHR